MIFNFLISFVVLILGSIFGLLPEYGISDIPYVGQWVYATLQIAVEYMNEFLTIVPPLETLWHVFIWVVIPFELVLMIVKLLLGSRTPANYN